MSAGVVSRGMFTVLEIAPERNGWAAAIIFTCACQAMLRVPLRGLKAQSKTARCSAAGRAHLRSCRSVDVGDDRLICGLVVAQRLQGQRHRLVDDLQHPAAGKLLVLHQGDVRLDARGVAIHQEADGAGGRQHGGLGVAEAVAAAGGQHVVPQPAGGVLEIRPGRRRRSARRRRDASASRAASARGCLVAVERARRPRPTPRWSGWPPRAAGPSSPRTRRRRRPNRTAGRWT